MEMIKKQIQGGIYLVIDPAMEEGILLKKLGLLLEEGLAAVQVWDNFGSESSIIPLLDKIRACCLPYAIPLLVNNRWELVRAAALDGVHFDRIPEDFDRVRSQMPSHAIIGITCSTDLSQVVWAEQKRLDYLSFCSMFPSSTATSCELVSFDTVKKAGEITRMPIFLAGGITPTHMELIRELPYSGIALISGLMSAPDPVAALSSYKIQLNTTVNET